MRRSTWLVTGLLATSAFTVPAFAQSAADPSYRNWDENGVDLVRGDYQLQFNEGTIGSGQAELALIRINASKQTPTQWDRIRLWRQQNVPNGPVDTFITLPDGSTAKFINGVSQRQNGETLFSSGDTSAYTAPDGTVIAFNNPLGWDGTSTGAFCNPTKVVNCRLAPESITSPDGTKLTFSWELQGNPKQARLGTITNNFGYGLWFTYQQYLPPGQQPTSAWFIRSGAIFQRNNVQQGSVAYAYPTAGTVDITDRSGQVWRVTGSSIRRPGAATANFAITGTTNALTVTSDGIATAYNRAISGNTVTLTRTRPLSGQDVIVSNSATSRITSVTDSLSRVTSYQYDGAARLTRVTLPEGNAFGGYTELTLDSRGNATQARSVAKTGSGVADIVTSATFAASCTNAKTCNQPTATTDARGNVTDYTYDSTHGGVLTVTAPAATVGGTRPQVRYAYTLQNGEYFLTGISTCQANAAPGCITTADEVKSSIGYDAYGNPTSVTSQNGTGTLSATRTMTYDGNGDVLTVDGPLAGTADTTTYRYNANRQLAGVIAPDPDGAGTRKHAAAKYDRNSWGAVTVSAVGTVNGTTDPDWAAFAESYRTTATYDANARVTRQALSSGGTNKSIVDQLYDLRGRPTCSVTHMNASSWGPQATSCAPIQAGGADGPDRVARISYDAASQVTSVESGIGTAAAATDAAATYTGNGLLATFKDGENNLTTYQYDGQNRLSKTLYPNTTKGSGTSNASDYEQLFYETTSSGTRTSGTVNGYRMRDGSLIQFAHDDLGRVTTKDFTSEPDVTYGYDLLNRMTSASQTGNSLSFAYDTLGRMVTEQQQYGTINNQYDLAGNRTRITWADGKYISYDYNPLSLLTNAYITNGVATDVIFEIRTYDDLARVTRIDRASGAMNYGYDNVSRLASIALDFSGTANDATTTYSYNPASQIISLGRDNDSFAWTGHGNGSTATVTNGLNQASSIGGSPTAYDLRGNLIVDPTTGKNFTYFVENRLATASGGVSMTYDPLGRLSTVTTPGSTRRLVYDGLDLVTEYDGAGAMTKRYAHGQGMDDTILEDTGSALDCTGTKFPRADERGSVVALADCWGGRTNVNAYDEFGKPQGGTIAGRFGYTGQTWIPEASLWNYKARVYSPYVGGRFLQPDPIGYAGGANLYAYVMNDPVNWIDPLGLNPADPPPDPPSRPIDVWSNPRFWEGRGQMAATTGGMQGPGVARPSMTDNDVDESNEITVTRRRVVRVVFRSGAIVHNTYVYLSDYPTYLRGVIGWTRDYHVWQGKRLVSVVMKPLGGGLGPSVAQPQLPQVPDLRRFSRGQIDRTQEAFQRAVRRQVQEAHDRASFWNNWNDFLEALGKWGF